MEALWRRSPLAAEEIAAEVGGPQGWTEATVKTHVGRILAKLDARDRAQLVVIAYESGLVHPQQ